MNDSAYAPLFFLTGVCTLFLAILYLRTRLRIERIAREQFDRWRAAEMQHIETEQRKVARREAQAELDVWVNSKEATIRQDAIDRSRSVIIGRVTEHMTPWLPSFPYNPKDARFIGSPVDMIVFDGSDAEQLRRIIFLEIKTNTSALSNRQRQLRDVIRAGRVEWQELRIPTDRSEPLDRRR
jgi:predicted Holliday junction resolvase-like endonuclease